MSVKEHSQRIVILVIVAIFFLTSLAAGVTVLYDALSKKDKKNDSTTQNDDIQKQIDELKKQQDNQNAQGKEGKLEGTKLANFNPVQKVDTIQVVDLVTGTGAEVKQGGTVTAHYTGALAKDGTIFQSSKDSGQPFTTQLANVIPGWQQGIPGMKVGGTRRLVIPASLAYGDKAVGNIPANSDLVFDIELIDAK